MSTNEVRSIQNLRRNIENQTERTEQEAPEIQVFGSENVSAKISLTPDENNSLFVNPHFDGTSSSGNITGEQKLTELPEDIKKKYPDEKSQTALKTLTEEQLAQARKLMDTKILALNIVDLVKNFKPEQIDNIKKQAEAMQESAGGSDKVFGIVMTRDYYEKGAYTMNCLSFDNILRTNLINDKLETRAIEELEEFTTEDGKKFRMKSSYDLNSGALSKVRMDYNDEYKTFVTSYEIRSKISKDGTMISREYSKPSSVKGVFNTELLTEDGVQDLSQARTKRNGKVVVKKDMESLDGTRTQYSYKDDPKGNRYMRYKITTKEGEVLMNNTKTFKVISDNEFKSTFNDDSYTITLKDNNLTVVDDNNKERTATIKLDDIKGDKEALIKTLKQMSGEELLALNDSVTSLEGIKDTLQSYYKPLDKSLHSGDNLFVVLHELGHAKDSKYLSTLTPMAYMETINSLISKDKDLQKIFDEEKAMFNKEFPKAQREHVDYFINTLAHYGGPDGGLKETTAESNAIHSTPKTHELLTMRTQYLQQYFPRTMAKLNELLNADRPAPKRTPIKFDFPKLEVPEFKFPTPKFPPTTK